MWRALVITGLISAYEGSATIAIEKKILKNAALVLGILSFESVVIQIYGLVIFHSARLIF
jgi:hypothetical protein